MHAAGLDAVGQLLQWLGLEDFARVGQAGDDAAHGQHAHLRACAGGGQGLGVGVVGFGGHGLLHLVNALRLGSLKASHAPARAGARVSSGQV